jgi:Ca2+-binding EF-hand superfamily protein
MKTTTMPLMLVLMTCAITTAQEPPSNKRPPPPVPPLLALFDTDRDGALSTEEIQSAAVALGKLDQNADGKITAEEMRPPRPEGKNSAAGDAAQGPPPPHMPPPPVIVALDTDKNGSVSAAELQNSATSLKTLDENSDGELSIQELLDIGPPPPMDEADGPQGPPPPPPSDEPLDNE